MTPTPRYACAEVASLNEKACQQMQNGEYSSAYETLSFALRSIKTSFASDRSSKSGELSMNSTVICSFSPGPLCPGANMSNEAGQFAVAQPMLLHFSASTDAIPKSRLLQVVSFCIIYNLALCRHLCALETADQEYGQSFLKQSVQLYMHAQRLLATCNLGVLYGLVLVNNLGHAHCCMQDTTSARLYYDALFKAVVCVKSAQRTVTQEDQQTASLMEGFLTNIFSMWGHSPNLAPAA